MTTRQPPTEPEDQPPRGPGVEATQGLPRNQILPGDALTVMKQLPERTIDQIFFSPPYFRLRDYGVGKNNDELGQEPSVDTWVDNLLAVCAQARRILTPTGSLWINVGDTYSRTVGQGAPRKSLLLGPERLALRLVEQGWHLRNNIVWAKAHHMPESVTDRLTVAWEHLYFLTTRPEYFFDLDAVRLPHTSEVRSSSRSRRTNRPRGGSSSSARYGQSVKDNTRPTGRTDQHGPAGRKGSRRPDQHISANSRGIANLKRSGLPGHPLGKNPGDVWTLSPSNRGLNHSAAMPLELAKRAIAAACPEKRCVECRMPFERDSAFARRIALRLGQTSVGRLAPRPDVPLRPTCDCRADSEPGVVLDPFMGSGTTAIAAERLGRDWLGIELSGEYVGYAEMRIAAAREETQ